MKKILPLVFCLSFVGLSAQNAEFEWAFQLGSPGQDDLNTITVDGNDHIYAVGNFSGTVDFDPGAGVEELTAVGDTDVYIAKYTSERDFLWVKKLGNANGINAVDLRVDSNGDILIAGYFAGTIDFDPGAGTEFLSANSGSNDGFILKLTDNGNFFWVKQIVANPGFVFTSGIDLGTDDSIYFGGPFQGIVDMDPGSGVFELEDTSIPSFYDGFVTKLDSDGNFEWAKHLSGEQFVWPLEMTTDNSGAVYTTGFFTDQADLDPGSGTQQFTSNGSSDTFIVKHDSNGDVVWASAFGGPDGDTPDGFTIDNQGNLVVTGEFRETVDFNTGAGEFFMTSNGGADAFLLKMTNTGEFIWAKQFGGPETEGGNAVRVDNFGRIYVAGRFQETVDFDPNAGVFEITSFGGFADGFICNLTSDGELNWAKQIGGPEGDFPFSLGTDSQNNLYVAGRFFDTCDFDPGTEQFLLTSAGERDSFILRWGQSDLGIADANSGKSAVAFPNPTTGYVQFSWNDQLGEVKLILRNSLGQIISSEILASGSEGYQINGPSGLYFIELVSSQNISETIKVLKR